MNKFTAFAAAGVLATSALFAVQASADESEYSAFPQMVAENPNAAAPVAHEGAHKGYGYGYQAGTLSRVSAKTSEFTVYRLGELSKAEREMYRDFANAEPARVAALQEQIKATPAVRNALLAENVQISSVIGEIKSADGSTAYVVR